MKPLLIDLYCGGGAAAMGYYRAGFRIIGVDNKPQPNYPFEFVQADARTFPLDNADAIHASPPCPHYSSATRDKSKHPDYYNETRQRLIDSGKPYVIENVIGAPYNHGIVLCGSMFGLSYRGEWLRRHRNFETSWLMFQPPCNHPQKPRPITITGHCFLTKTTECKHSRQTTFEIACKLMGIDWLDRKHLPDAIPPTYTEFIGLELIKQI